ncbi:hypothetical protein GCM10010199_01030 [Dactylosporangium roseum]
MALTQADRTPTARETSIAKLHGRSGTWARPHTATAGSRSAAWATADLGGAWPEFVCNFVSNAERPGEQWNAM